jgi:hypothetical protein
MPLTDVERDITKAVVHRFLSQKEPTPRRPLIIQFKTPEALDRLVKYSILQTPGDHQSFLPLPLAFHYCAEPEALRLAKESVKVVAHSLRELYLKQPDRTEFTPADVESCAHEIYGHLHPQTISLGLYLAQEFGVLVGWGLAAGPTEISAPLRVSESIVKLNDFDNLWDDFVRQRSEYLERQTGPGLREAFLQQLYDIVRGREGATISPMQFFQVGLEVGLSNESIGQAMRHLLSEGFLEQKPASEAVALTHKGVLEVERLMAALDSQPRHSKLPIARAFWS